MAEIIKEPIEGAIKESKSDKWKFAIGAIMGIAIVILSVNAYLMNDTLNNLKPKVIQIDNALTCVPGIESPDKKCYSFPEVINGIIFQLNKLNDQLTVTK